MNLNLSLKLTLVFILFALAVLLGVNVLGYTKGQDALASTASMELEAIAGEKEAAIHDWILDRQATAEILANSPTIQQELTNYLKFGPAAKAANNRLLLELAAHTGSGKSFLNLFVFSAESGKVLISVDPDEQGESIADHTYLMEGEDNTYTTPIYYSADLQAPAMTTVAPLFSKDGELLGVLAGRLDLNGLNDIIQRRSGLRETDEAFLVNGSGLVVTQPRFLPPSALFQQRIQMVPITLCLQGKSGTGFANDYHNTPVITSYRWLPEYQMCLIVKISQAEALAPIIDFRNNMIWIVLAVLAVASVVAFALSRTIVRPILSMQAAAQRYSRGDLDIRIPETRQDELGMLAYEFNQMAASLARKELELREHARTLEKKVEERTKALQDALEFNERIVTSSPIGIFTYRHSGECLSVNAAAARMVGATVEQLRSQNFHQIESWKRSGLYDMAKRAIATKQLVAGDVHVHTSFGREAWYQAQFVTFHSSGEEMLLMMFSDITDRKQAEQTLRESEDRYRDLVEHIRDLIGTHDLQGNILSINPAATELLGYDMDTLLSMNMRDLLAPEMQSGFDDYIATIQKDGHASGLMLLQMRNGARRIWEYNNTIRTDSSRVPVVRALARDVTERRQAEKALKEKERLLSEAQRIGRIGSWSYDIPGDSMTFSDEMYRLLDVLPEDFYHNRENLLAMVYPSDRFSAATWMDDLRLGTQAKELNFRIFRKNGELRYLQCSGAVSFDESGKPARFIGMIQDISERRLAEIQIEQQIKRLTALSEIDRAIISSSDQRYTFGVILSHLISQLQIDAADILLLDSERNALTYAAGQGFRTKVMESAWVRVGESHAGRAAKERRMIRISDLREETNLVEFNAFVAAEGFVSYIAMPLIAKGSVQGVLEVYQRSLLQPYQEWLNFFNTLTGQLAIAIENTSLFENLRATNKELVQAYDATIEGWSRAMDLRDRETEGHTQRVTNLTVKLARALGMDEARLMHIRRGALLHDIGKLGVPDYILLKPDKLTPEEWEIMQKHTEFAYDMLAPIEYLKPALSIPYFHHEKWDGSGYPFALEGKQIPLEARVFALADVWDALTSDRPYRSAWTQEQALAYIREQSGRHFDPQLVDLFLKLIGTDQ